MIQALIQAARRYGENFQNRAYNTQTWELWLDAFPDVDYISLPRPPLQSVTSVEYYDTSNVKYTMSATDYFVDTKSEPGKVTLGYGKSWPSSTTLRPYNGVCVTYVAGHVGQVPDTIKQAMLLLIGHWYENREGGTERPITQVPLAVEALLWQERIL
jgi:uncharacterized phiE125 gp8 family phage protein